MSNSEISHIDFKRQHSDEVAALGDRRDAEVARGTAIVATAHEGHARTTAEITARHVAEEERRLVTFQRWAAEQLAAPVAAFVATPDRGATKALIAAFQQVDAEAVRLLNRGVTRELQYAFIAEHAKEHPESLSRLALPQNSHDNGIGVSIDAIGAKACEALRRGATGDALARLDDLEEQIGRVGAQSGVPSCSDAEQRFEAVRFGGSSDVIAAELQRLDKQAFSARNGTPEEIHARSRLYEQAVAQGVLPSRVAAYIAEQLANAANVVANTVASAVSEPEPPAKRRKSSEPIPNTPPASFI